MGAVTAGINPAGRDNHGSPGARTMTTVSDKRMTSPPRSLLAAPALLLAGLMLAGCGTADAVVFKTFAGEMPGEKGTIPPAVANGPLLGAGPPGLGPTRFRKDRPIGQAAPRTPASKAAPKTAPKTAPKSAPKIAPKSAVAAALAGRRAALEDQIYRQDDELQRLRRSIRLQHAAYRKAVGGFGLAKDRRLPDDDAAYRANMRAARGRLARMNGDLLKLNALATRVHGTTTQTARLLAAVRAARARMRAGEARRELAALGAEVERTDALSREMQAEIQADIEKQRAYVQRQHRGLDQLAQAVIGEAGKPSTRVRQLEAETIEEAVRPKAGAGPAARRRSARPLVRIRFTRPGVDYKTALYKALQAALKARPGLAFDVVGVSPKAAGQAGVLDRAQQVRFAMADMGVPPERVRVSTETSKAAKSDEVRIFVR